MATHLITLDHLDQLNHILDEKFYNQLVLLKQSVDSKVNEQKKKIYKCNKCNYTASHSSNLTSHYRLIHTEEKPWKCKVCSKTFGRSDYLRKHERTHTGERPHSCNICGKSFKQRSALTSHLKHRHK